MQKSFLVITLVAMLGINSASADNGSPSYSYLELAAVEQDTDISGFDIDPDGHRLKLSVELGDSLFAFVDRIQTDGRFGGSSFDFDREGYGFGFRGDTWFASYSYNTWEPGNNSFDVNSLRVGFRNYLIQDRLEFNASYSWNVIEDADNDDGFQVGFVFELTELLHVTFGYETIGGDQDLDMTSIGLRLSF